MAISSPWRRSHEEPHVVERGDGAVARRARSSTHGRFDRMAHEPKEALMTTKRVRSGFIATVQQLPTATLLLITVSLLCLFGLVMVGSASSVVSISLYGTPWAILVREAMWMGIGTLALFLAIKFDYRKLRRLSPLLLLGT